MNTETEVYRPTANDKVNPRVLAARDANHALLQITKGSKQRAHYITLAKANNLFRAMVVHYELAAEFTKDQTQLLQVLRDVEARKNRQWFTNEKIIAAQSLSTFTDLIQSMSDEQFEEIMKFVELNSADSKYLVYAKK